MSWYASLYKGFIITTVLLFLISIGTTGQTNIGSLLAGYSVLTLSIIMIMTVLLSGVSKNTQGSSMLRSFLTVIVTTGPFMLMLGIIGIVLYLVITYKNEIIDGHVSTSYGAVSNGIIMLFITQLFILYNTVSSKNFQMTGKVERISSMILYLLGIIEAVFTIVLVTILKYYTTDG
jgi:hypothetical protein